MKIRWQDYIEERNEVMVGKPTFKGTRLTVEFVLKQLGTEMSHAELLDHYPTLRAGHLRPAVLFAADIVAMYHSKLRPKALFEAFDSDTVKINPSELLEKLKSNPLDEVVRLEYMHCLEDAADPKAAYMRMFFEHKRFRKELNDIEWEMNTRQYAMPDEWLDIVFPLDIRSPMAGTFYASPTLNHRPFVGVGSVAQPGSIVAKIEAMKIFNDLYADVQGAITKVCVSSGETVEYNQLLFKVGRLPRPIAGG